MPTTKALKSIKQAEENMAFLNAGRLRKLRAERAARVEHPACACCPHTELSDLERDRLARDVWDMCPDSGCLRELCDECQHAESDYVACSGCGLRNHDTRDRFWNCPDYPKCRASVPC
jgi:hypothetical protein